MPRKLPPLHVPTVTRIVKFMRLRADALGGTAEAGAIRDMADMVEFQGELHRRAKRKKSK